MEFEWDAHKRQLNLVKHGVYFEDAVIVFNDPNYPHHFSETGIEGRKETL